MSKSHRMEWTCDRCGATTMVAATSDMRVPEGWSKRGLDGAPFDLCQTCTDLWRDAYASFLASFNPKAETRTIVDDELNELDPEVDDDETCSSTFVTNERHYWCKLDPGHPSLHRWDDVDNIERGRVWTDEGIDFLEGPYGADAEICRDQFVDNDDGVIACVRPKGHSGAHGNYHDEDSPTYWTDPLEVPIAWGTIPQVEGAYPTADFKVVVGKQGQARELRLNGLALPRVADVTIEYLPSEQRKVIVEFYATSLVEVPE